MQPKSMTCTLGLTIEHLTAWQDNQLGSVEQPRLSAHIPACAQCQSLLADLAQIKSGLSALRTPDLRARIWRGVQGGIARSPRTYLASRALWRSAVGVLALITLVALFVQVLNFGNKQRSPLSVHASPTASVVPIVVFTPTTGPAAPIPHLADWQSSGPAFAKFITFAQSDPLTGYACGRAYLNGSSGLSALSAPQHSVTPGPDLLESNLPLGVTHDGGKTWQTITTTIRGLECSVTVDPVNPRDILIRYTTCPDTCTFYNVNYQGKNPYMARSLDGGQTWARVTLPSDPDYHNGMLLGDTVWVGSTLFVSAQQNTPTNALGKSYILKSEQGTALTFLAHQVDVYSMIGQGDTLYVPGNRSVAITRDGGATWTNQQLSHNNLAITLVTANTDGSILLGSYFTTDGPQPAGLPDHLPLLESRDGGVTWVILPSPANSAFFENGISKDSASIAPDGTIVAMCDIFKTTDYKIHAFGYYTLAPGSQTWQKQATTVPEMLLTVSYDAQGHPARLWGRAGANSDDILNSTYFGLQYYPLQANA